MSLFGFSRSEKAVTVKKKYSDEELISILKNEGYATAELVREQVISVRIEGDGYLLVNAGTKIEMGWVLRDAGYIPLSLINK